MKAVENGPLTGSCKNARAPNLHLKTDPVRMRVRASAFENGSCKISRGSNSLKEMHRTLKTRRKTRFQSYRISLRDLRFQFLGKRVCALGKKVCFFRRPHTLHTTTLFMRPSASVLQDWCFQFLASAGMFDPTPLYDYSVRGASSDTTHILREGMFSMEASRCILKKASNKVVAFSRWCLLPKSYRSLSAKSKRSDLKPKRKVEGVAR